MVSKIMRSTDFRLAKAQQNKTDGWDVGRSITRHLNDEEKQEIIQVSFVRNDSLKDPYIFFSNKEFKRGNHKQIFILGESSNIVKTSYAKNSPLIAIFYILVSNSSFVISSNLPILSVFSHSHSLNSPEY